MKYIILKYIEEQTITYDSFIESLIARSEKEINDNTVNDIIRFLLKKKVFKIQSTHDYITSIREDFNQDDLENLASDFENKSFIDKYYTISFVGVVVVKNVIIKCFPKYLAANKEYELLPEDSSEESLKEILSVLRKYNSRKERLYTIDGDIIDKNMEFISSSLFFITDYLDNGLYNNDIEILEKNGDGMIDWVTTVFETFPLLNENGPVYFDVYSHNTRGDTTDYFRNLHKFIINECSDFLEKTGFLDLFSIRGNLNFDISMNDLGGVEYILYKIRNEMGVQFTTKKLDLLSKMIAFISQINTEDRSFFDSLFGTYHFHTVWEDICSHVFDNQLQSEIITLPYQSLLNYKKLISNNENIDEESNILTEKINEYKHKKLTSLISGPKWLLYRSGYQFELSSTYKPDIVQIYIENSILHFTIMDAKYRVLGERLNHIDGTPGVEEITKQYMYQLIFSDLLDSYTIEKSAVRIRNVFLFPGKDIQPCYVGEVEVEILRRLGLVRIEAIRIPARKMYELYLTDGRVNKVSEL